MKIGRACVVPTGLLVLLGLLPGSGVTQPQPSPDSTVEFVLGNIEYVLLHELAHVLINDLDIPIIGPEEHAADYIATTVLLRPDQFDHTRAERARAFLLATANGLATSWEGDLQAGKEIHFWDAHSLTIQRFYQIICLVYGSNPEMFATLPPRAGMPAHRAARCPAEFARADRALDWLLANYGRTAGDAPEPPVHIVIDAPPTHVSEKVIRAMRATALLDNAVKRLRESFTLPEPLTIRIRRCRARQAAWVPHTRELVLCFELIDNYYFLGLQRSAYDRSLLLNERND